MMSNEKQHINFLFRDGTSQQGRRMKALDPAYFSIEEHSTEDLIRFARKFAKELNFFNLDNLEAGDWTGFLGLEEEQVQDMLAFLEKPDQFIHQTAKLKWLTRPHLIAFLAYLDMLQQSKAALDNLTRRHLDFYLRKVLQLASKAAAPDRVHVLFEPEDGVEVHPKKAGTLLYAGRDSEGKDLHYATKEDILINQGKVADIRRVFVDEQVYADISWVEGEENPAGEKYHALGADLPNAQKNNLAEIGFAISSPLLKLEEGERKLQLDLKFKQFILSQLQVPFTLDFDEILRLLISTSEGWRKINNRHIKPISNLTGTLIEKLAFGNIFFIVDIPERNNNPQASFIKFKDGLTLFITAQAGEDTPFQFLCRPLGYSPPSSSDSLFEKIEFRNERLIEYYFLDLEEEEEGVIKSRVRFFQEDDKGKLFFIADYRLTFYWYKIEEVISEFRIKVKICNLFKYPFIDPNIVGKGRVTDEIIFSRSALINDSEIRGIVNEYPSGSGFSDNDLGQVLELPNGLIVRIDKIAHAQIIFVQKIISRSKEIDYSSLKVCRFSNASLQLRLNIEASFSSEFPAIVPPPFNDKIPSKYPILKLELNSTDNGKTIDYQTLEELRLDSFQLVVIAEQIRNFALRNDEAIIDPKSSFHPFGIIPKKGAGLYFSHPELNVKSIDSLNLSVAWKGKPENLPMHYKGYSGSGIISEVLTEDKFSVNLSVIPGSAEKKEAHLFLPVDKNKNVNLDFSDLGIDAHLKPILEDLEDPFLQPRYFKLELQSPDFQHDNYSLVLQKIDQKPDEKCHIGWEQIPDENGLTVFYWGTPGITVNVNISSNGEYFEISERSLKINGVGEGKKAIEIVDEWYSWKTDEENNTRGFELGISGTGDSSVTSQNKAIKVETNIPYQDLSPIPPPYTPEMSAISLGYKSSLEAGLEQSQGNPTSFSLLQITPFGSLDISNSNATKEKKWQLFPEFPGNGHLFIGLKEIEAPQEISLLFQMVPGTDESKGTYPDIEWYYLDQDSWQPIPTENILFDHTKQLLNSGVIRFHLPAVEDLDHHLMPPGLYWLRASTTGAAMASDLIAIHAQAAEAVWIDNGITAGHLDRPLPTESIQELVQEDPNIRAIHQPYTSFGGRRPEPDNRFQIRVSERLRHKNRGLSAWDYERIVLEEFPQIYKVKCIWSNEKQQAWNFPVSNLRLDWNPANAKVNLVVIPDISNSEPFFPLQPKASRALLEEIEEKLRQRTSPFINITVKNPRYEYICYRMDIRYKLGYEPNYYRTQLNEALQRFLSPWAYEKGAEILFGNRIYHSTVIHFIEKLEYVDYVVNFKLAQQFISGVENPRGCIVDKGWAGARFPDSILVSHREHIIGTVHTDIYDPDEFKGIGYEKIGIDHKVPDF